MGSVLPRLAALLAPIALMTACASGPASAGGSAGAPVAAVAHPAYKPAFDALLTALEAEDLPVARATSRRLRTRLEGECESLPSIPEARRSPANTLSHQVLAGELPSRESAEAALRIVDGFDRVIEGRARMGALSLAVRLARVPGEELVSVRVAASSIWPATLELRPGAGTIEIMRTSLEPLAGDERRISARIVLPEATVLEIPANSECELELCLLPIEVPMGAIATRMRVDAVYLGGTIGEGEEAFPARDIEVRAGSRTDLASKIPATSLGPEPLLELVERGRAPLAALLERTVRIPPERFPETLDRLGESLELRPLEAIRPVVPSLRWLAATESFGRDALAWRVWLLKRLQQRRRDGELTG